jgi:hypothetical protein
MRNTLCQFLNMLAPIVLSESYDSNTPRMARIIEWISNNNTAIQIGRLGWTRFSHRDV